MLSISEVDMPIDVEWDNEAKSIIRQTFEGKWTWKEFLDASNIESRNYIQSVEHKVHVISDFRESDGLPISGSALSYAKQVMMDFPENGGLVVIVDESYLLNSLVNIFRKIFRGNMGKRTYAVKTIEEAYALIEAQNGEALENFPSA